MNPPTPTPIQTRQPLVALLLVSLCCGSASSLTAAAPPNDPFDSRTALAGDALSLNATSTGATKEPGEPSHAGNAGGRSVWWSWTAYGDGPVTIHTTGSSFDTTLGVYTGTTVGTLTPVASNDDFGGLLTSSLTFNAIGGTVYAIAVDGYSGASGPLRLSLTGPLQSTTVLVQTGADWRYLDNGSNQGTNWTTLGFNDSTWAQGPAQLGYGDGDESTVVSFGPNASNKPITTYFRRRFTPPIGVNFTNLTLRLLRDDGAVVYVNGVEAIRSNMPGAPTDFQTPALAAIGGADESTFITHPLPPSLLRNGDNIIAVEIHQSDSTSSDLSFDLELSAGSPPLTPVSFFGFGAVWRFLDDGSNQGTGWVAPDHNDSGWNSGPGELGYGDGDEATVVGFGGNPNNKFLTTYFRRAFTVTGAANLNELTARVLRDDGAVVYLNGVEVFRGNMPNGPVQFNTEAVSAQPDTTTDTFGVNPRLLVEGINVLAVEVHQNAPDSSDLSFNMELTGVAGALGNVPPSIDIVSPANNSMLSVAVPVVINAVALDPDGTVTNVLFLEGASLLGSVTSPPYTFSWPNVPLGVYTLRAVASDNTGLVRTSAPVSITLVANLLPTVSITSPAHNSFIVVSNDVTVTAQANDPDGSVTSVVFFEGTRQLGIDFTSPYSSLWTNPPAGTYNLTAVVTDNSGTSVTSAVARVTAAELIPEPTQALISLGANWRYLDNGSDQQTLWREIAFNDSTWTNGFAELGYGDGDEATVVGFGPFSFDKYTTTYYRHSFTLLNPAGFTNAYIQLRRDDGAVVYLNGVEIARDNMGTGPVNYLTQASNAADDGRNLLSFTLSPFLLRSGINVVAVEIHQDSGNSSDTSFDLALIVNDPNTPNAPPHITLDSPADGAAFIAPAEIALMATAVDPDGAVSRVEFFEGTTSVGLDTSAPFRLTLTNVMAGTYNLSAVASDNAGARRTSGVSRVMVTIPIPTLNDHFASAISLPTEGTSIGANETATKQTGEPNHAGNPGGRSAWWSFTPTVTGPLTITTTGSAFDTLLAIYTGSAVNALTLVASNDQDPIAGGNTSRVSFNATAGTHYRIAVDGYNGARGRIVLNIGIAPPTVLGTDPVAGPLTSLSQITVTFSEPVTGVSASDLLIGGSPANTVTGINESFTFTFTQPPAGPVLVSFAPGHDIRDLDLPPNSFDHLGAGATWQYKLTDAAAPGVVSFNPPASTTLNDLDLFTITFSEPVAGIEAADLLVNGVPATGLSGSAAGPYTFSFPDPTPGPVTIAFAGGHGIHDAAPIPNPFPGGSWNYTYDPEIDQSILITELMYHPASGGNAAEFIELYNNGTDPVDLTGWSFGRGVNFVFPSHTIAPGTHLVIAADLATFNSLHPSVTNVLGNWSGSLANGGEEVELENALGDRIDLVPYAEQGDWATRIRWTEDTRGWRWSAAHDGLGKSLELRNRNLPNNNGQNWQASIPDGGTPGAPNSAASTNIPPLILDTAHFPLLPRSTNNVTVTARLIDENPAGLSATLFHRDATLTSTNTFLATPMFDDGAHNDGAPGDGIWGAIVPAAPHGTVIDFYVSARDAANNTRTWPAAAGQVNPAEFRQTANALFQFDDTEYTGTQPIARLIFTGEEEDIITSSAIRQSDAQMNATFIAIDGTGTQLRYNAGVRIRGAGSRSAAVPNYRVNFPSDNPWKDVVQINLNAQYGYGQVVGAAISALGGLPASDASPIQVRVNAVNLANSGSPQFGAYALVEPVTGDWAANHYPNDSQGNAYTARRPNTDLSHLGTDPATYINTGYGKQSNGGENDWTDLFNLTFVIDPATTPGEIYVEEVRKVLNVEEWMTYFAMNALLGNGETSLGNGVGDDYDLYRGVLDPRFVLVAHDWDTIMSQGQGPDDFDANIFQAAALPTVDRFLRHPEFVSIYYKELIRLITGVLSEEEVQPLIDRLIADYVPAAQVQQMKDFARDRNAFVLDQIPLAITVTTNLPIVNGLPRTTSRLLNLSGRANVLRTRSILVNGSPATYVHWQGSWGSPTLILDPGVNRLVIQALDESGEVFETATFDVWYDTAGGTTVSAPVTADTTWTRANSPFRIPSGLQVNAGATLTIEPGTTVYFANNASITINGRLLAEGTPIRRIRLTRDPGTTNQWSGLRFINSTADNRLSAVDFEFTGNREAIEVVNSQLTIDDATWARTTRTLIELTGASLVVRNSLFPVVSNHAIQGSGIRTNGQVLIENNRFLGANGEVDLINFTGGKRPGPILQIMNNVFEQASDDAIDLTAADAHIEGNVFLNVQPDAVRTSPSAAIDAEDGAQITAARNLFQNCANAVLLKEGAFLTAGNNTFANLTVAAIAFDQPGRMTPPAAGAVLDGNILWNNTTNFLHVHNNDPVQGTVSLTVRNSIVGGPSLWPGNGNLNADPLFLDPVNDLRLAANSPARQTGPNGLDMGAFVPAGASIDGEPRSPTSRHSATLTIGGPGITHYAYRLNDAPYGPETPIGSPIVLAGLENCANTVLVIGKNSAGIWQPLSTPTISRTWIVSDSVSRVVLNEILARNGSSYTNGTSHPDAIELFNESDSPVDLSGMHLSDDPENPRRYTFPPGTTLAPGAYLVLHAGNEPAQPGIHLGFNLSGDGEVVTLYAADGTVLDSILFGTQLLDASIGRRRNGNWALNIPTLGGPNRTMALGRTSGIQINEWLAGSAEGGADFVELWNPDLLPVDLGGLILTDNPIGAPTRHLITPLTFIPPTGFTVFLADAGTGGNHLNFQLASEQGIIGLLAPGLSVIDIIYYGSQTTARSEGRQPTGAETMAFFNEPTPGAGNPIRLDAEITTVSFDLMGFDQVWRYDETGIDLGTFWRLTNYNDTAWPFGPGILGAESSSLPQPIRTPLTAPNNGGPITTYFRTTLVVDTNLAGFNLALTTLADDGAVIHINETEVLRLRVPEGQTADTTASESVNNATLESFIIPADSLVIGTNHIAVEVHQTDSGSSDVVWGLAIDATRSITNIITITAVLNEILANNVSLTNTDGTLTDWLELYNPSGNAIDAAGFSLTDDVSSPQRWVFPSGSIIPAQGYLRVRFDPATPASLNSAGPLNTGFGLDAAGDALFLFDAAVNGAALLDAISFGFQAPDLPLGRFPNATGPWVLNLPTPGASNIPAQLGNAANLRVNEWMADPASGEDFFEIHNPTPQPIPMGGLFLTDNLTDPLQYQIPALSFIGSGSAGYKVFIADASPGLGADHTNFRLSAGGESIGISTSAGTLIDAVSFGPQLEGVSQGRLVDGSPNIVSFPGTESPGESNFRPLPDIVINEVLTHSDPPLEDAIELLNTGSSVVDIGGWFLSDSRNALTKFQIPFNTLLPPGGFAVFYENQFNPDPNHPAAFALSSANGETVWLASADRSGILTGERASARFGPAANGVSFGRHDTSAGTDFTALSALTFGADDPATVEEWRTGTGRTNAPPLVGPIVIAEIMYHPPDRGNADNTTDEFIAIRNTSGFDIPLFDTANPSNTWRLRDAVRFNFPSPLTLAPNGEVLVVSFNPLDPVASAAFRSAYSLDTETKLAGPYEGVLSNREGNIELLRPDAPSLGDVPYILADRVHYLDRTPWPPQADGDGNSLHRLALLNYGNDPVNWAALPPTPGPMIADTDMDLIPDDWENAFGLDPGDPDDALQDLDLDGLTNLDEFRAGTDPANPNSTLRMRIIPGSPLVLEFVPVADRSYTIEYRAAVDGGSWTILAQVPPRGNTNPVQVSDPTPGTTRFYRIRTP